MTFEFIVDKKFILGGLLFNNKRNSPYIEIKNTLWNKYKDAYDLINRGIDYRNLFLLNTNEYFDSVSKHLLEMLEEGKDYPEVQKLYLEAEEYKKWIIDAWDKSQAKIESELASILKINLPNTPLKVLLVPYIIGGGMYLGNNTIFWGDLYGSGERFPNYNLIYLIHESLHSIFGRTNIEHSIIELIADNELRLRLNGEGEYFFYDGKAIGHDYLLDTERKLFDDWKLYLKDQDMNIKEFTKIQLGKSN